ncbi:SRP40, C-terminal domain-domain-containing protein [Leucosporidium creatinivorum]|uniref:SRP40, C-terminal domain-domain-containing protein n=1 Tax=Leucosporidium creatinivorum TaxID=106004 RepID=A0A1Y2C984_9BASI|nr:SRP40, C-terminal domain-domain-containing protein [Leucosporidium creatinivorum]
MQTPVNKKRKAPSSSSSSSSSSESDSDSSSSSSSSSSSDSDSDAAPATKKTKKSSPSPAPAPAALPTPAPLAAVIASTIADAPSPARSFSGYDSTASGSGYDSPRNGGKGKGNRVANAPFRRVKAEEVTFHDDRLRDMSFAARPAGMSDYGARASADLIVTRGKGFVKEKNKKKRGSYRGGDITMESHSIKFN